MIVDEIKDTKTLFSSVSFRHEGRSTNGEAHRLARSAVSLAIGRQFWLLEPPGSLCIPVQLSILDERPNSQKKKSIAAHRPSAKKTSTWPTYRPCCRMSHPPTLK
jgi:hypothetical protein